MTREVLSVLPPDLVVVDARGVAALAGVVVRRLVEDLEPTVIGGTS